MNISKAKSVVVAALSALAVLLVPVASRAETWEIDESYTITEDLYIFIDNRDYDDGIPVGVYVLLPEKYAPTSGSFSTGRLFFDLTNGDIHVDYGNGNEERDTTWGFIFEYNTLNSQYHVPELDIPGVGQMWVYQFSVRPGEYWFTSGYGDYNNTMVLDPNTFEYINNDYFSESVVQLDDGDSLKLFCIYGDASDRASETNRAALKEFAESQYATWPEVKGLEVASAEPEPTPEPVVEEPTPEPTPAAAVEEPTPTPVPVAEDEAEEAQENTAVPLAIGIAVAALVAIGAAVKFAKKRP